MYDLYFDDHFELHLLNRRHELLKLVAANKKASGSDWKLPVKQSFAVSTDAARLACYNGEPDVILEGVQNMGIMGIE